MRPPPPKKNSVDASIRLEDYIKKSKEGQITETRNNRTALKRKQKW